MGDPELAQAAEVAHALAGGAVDVHHLVTGGRNSRIYHVHRKDCDFALKQYPSQKDDPRDRLSTEVGALQLLERYHLDTVPRVVGIDRERGYALLSWIEGVEVSEVSDADIDAAVALLRAIHAMRNVPQAAEQPLAAEACLSGQEIARQIQQRLERLRSVASDERELTAFLNGAFSSYLRRALADAPTAMQGSGLDFAAELPQGWRSLVPSDFGFHNSLRRTDGSLAFVDFEYFGWDDPVKLVADILLHPGKTLPPPQRKRFRQAALELYGDDPAFGHRLSAYMPLFGLRWVLILLNEFIPERWQRRILAGDTGSWREAKIRQLGVAREFLTSLPQKLED